MICAEQCTVLFLALFTSFLDPFALGDVVHHPDRPDDAAGFIPEVVAFFMDDADLTIGFPYNPVFDLVGVPSFTYRAGIRCVNRHSIIRVYCFQECLICGIKFSRFEAENPVHLVRP